MEEGVCGQLHRGICQKTEFVGMIIELFVAVVCSVMGLRGWLMG